MIAVASRCRCVSSVSPLCEIARDLKSMPLKRPRPISATARSMPPLPVSALRDDDVHVGLGGIADVLHHVDFFADVIAEAVVAVEIHLQPAVRVLRERRSTATHTRAPTRRPTDTPCRRSLAHLRRTRIGIQCL